MTHALAVQYALPEDLRPAKRNAKTHPPEQIAQLAQLFRDFGFTNPLLVDEKHTIIAGHGRREAALLLGEELKKIRGCPGGRVPYITLKGLSTAQKRALLLADNRVAQNSGWDEDILRLELKDLNEEGTVELGTLGFGEDELLGYLGITGREPPPGADFKASWAVVVELETEAEQVELLERLSAEGFKCKALIA